MRARHRPPARPPRTPRAGGRATWRPTSPWTPRTCCSVSSSASRTRAPSGPPLAGSAPSSARTAPGPPSTAAPANCPPPSRRTSRCDWPATRPRRRTWPTRRPGSRERGGIAAARVFTRIWLALFGWWKWDDLPELPPELIYLPKWFPLNIYSFGCWARQTIVPLTVVGAPPPGAARALRPRRTAHRPRACPTRRARWRRSPAGTASSSGSTRPCTSTARSASAPLRRTAHGRCARWIIERQENDGCWGGIQPPAVYSVIALHLLGYDLEHPVMRAGLESLDRFAVWREDGSPDDRGVPVAGVGHLPGHHRTRRRRTCRADHPALVKAADWMLGEQITRPGDWSVRRPATRPRRLGLRVPQRQLPGHRRHRRGRPRAAPGAPTRTGRGWTRSIDRGVRVEPRHAVQERRLGRLRRGQHQPASPTGCRSATSARSSTRRPPTSPPTWWRCSPPSAWSTTRAPGAASTGCWPNRSPAAPGSDAGASTTSTAPARWCPP